MTPINQKILSNKHHAIRQTNTITQTTGRRVVRQTDKAAVSQTYIQTGRRTYIQEYIQTDMPSASHTDRHTDGP